MLNLKKTGAYWGVSFMILALSSCTVSKVSLKKDKISSVKVVAVLPFEIENDLPKSLAAESEEFFKSCFIDAGVTVVERKKISDILKENEISMSFSPSLDKIHLLGADTVMTGRITQYSETVHDVEYMGYKKDEHGFEITSKIDAHTNRIVYLEKELIKDKVHNLNIKIFLRMVAVATGETIMEMENALSTKTFPESDDEMRKPTLDNFKNQIFAQMNADIKNILLENKKKRD
jgi:hypothetical protein